MKDKSKGKYATLKDVAKLANTSVSSVSYVLSNSKTRYVSDELRDRVNKAVKELNYVKSTPASSLKGKKIGIIAVVIPQFENTFFNRMSVAIERTMNEDDYILTICNSFDDPVIEEKIIQRLIQQRVDGIIISPAPGKNKGISLIKQVGIPFVAIERPYSSDIDRNEYDLVSTNNYYNGYIAADHLIKNNHKNIAYIGWESKVSNLVERKEGFEQALKDNHIRKSKNILEGNMTREAGYELTKHILSRSDEITGLVWGHHVIGEGGLIYLRDHKVHLPKDLSVIVIGSPKWVEIHNPSITYVRQEEYEVGIRAAKRLLYKINVSESEGVMKEEVKGHIIEGMSVKTLKED